MIFEPVTQRGHEQIVFCHDRKSGLRAIIAVHNSALGQAGPSGVKASLGGTRRRFYETEEAAVDDVLRLSEGMTYKSASAELALGGAKSVVMLNSKEEERSPTEAEARAMGRAVERMCGRYIAAEDMNVDEQYVDWMAQETSFVIGGATRARGGDPSPYTAQGVVNGIKGGLAYERGSASLSGVTVAIQGVGMVGEKVARIVHTEGARLIVADTRKDKVDALVKELGAKASTPDDILSVECDVLCPCALGQIINDRTIGSLRCEIVAPGANNALEDAERHGKELKERNVVYCPDFIVNAAGVIRLGGLWLGLTEEEINEKIDRIEGRVQEILTAAEKLPSAHEAAIAYANERLAAGEAAEAPGVRTTTAAKRSQPHVVGES